MTNDEARFVEAKLCQLKKAGWGGRGCSPTGLGGDTAKPQS